MPHAVAAKPGAAVKRWHWVNVTMLTGHLALSGAVLRAMLETAVPGHRPRKDNAATDAISGAQRVGTRRVS